MPVFGYLVIPIEGSTDRLCSELNSIPYCEVIPAKNRDVLVLVTNTPDDATEKDLQSTLKSLATLQSLNMTFGHNDDQQPEKGEETMNFDGLVTTSIY